MKPACADIRRARPLLGTFVEIAAAGACRSALERAVETAFTAVAEVHRLMSFQEPDSDLARLNRDAASRPVAVHPWTFKVLEAALDLQRRSAGIFDIAVGVGVGIELLPGRRARFANPNTAIDLGGIAKGFAVDRAVKALKCAGVPSGVVNAGGDLRVFGLKSELVHLRHPAEPMRPAGAIKLHERALATSGIYFAQKRRGRAVVSSLLDGRTCRSSRKVISVSVAASACMMADALTKIVFVLREKSMPLLARYHADALLLERDGAPLWKFHSPCDTCDPTRFD
jgi:thiamine biosynthesis lipoprotein